MKDKLHLYNIFYLIKGTRNIRIAAEWQLNSKHANRPIEYPTTCACLTCQVVSCLPVYSAGRWQEPLAAELSQCSRLIFHTGPEEIYFDYRQGLHSDTFYCDMKMRLFSFFYLIKLVPLMKILKPTKIISIKPRHCRFFFAWIRRMLTWLCARLLHTPPISTKAWKVSLNTKQWVST